MHLHHLHLPNLTRYARASPIQESLVSRFLAHKANPTSTPPPPPTLLTFQLHPVYTLGRREANSLTPAQISTLQHNPDGRLADFAYTSRGGQTTYHGPGQLTAYLICDLRRHGLSSRCYIHMLESAVIATCAAYGVEGFRTENPGVWVSDAEKVCAVGVHLRRYVSSHGVGLNVSESVREWMDRIVACGLEGKGPGTLEGVTGRMVQGGVEGVAGVLARGVGARLDGVERVVRVSEGDVWDGGREDVGEESG